MTSGEKIAIGVVAAVLLLCLLCSCLALGFALGRATAGKATVIYKYRWPEEQMRPWELRGPVFGQVVKVEQRGLVVKAARGRVEVRVNEDTNILRLGEPIGLDEVKRGDRVIIFGKWEDENTILARTILLLTRGWRD